MYRKLLVVVDDSVVTQSAIRQAIEIAQIHRAEILFFYLLPHYSITSFDALPVITLTPEEFQSQANDHAHKLLRAASQLAERAGVHSYRAMASCSDEVRCICNMAKQRNCDLIVVGTDGDNAVMRILKGSVIPGLITAAMVPVLVCQKRKFRDAYSRRTLASMQAQQRRESLSRRRNSEGED